jgi:predicted HicB family RNase H-like nuclease
MTNAERYAVTVRKVFVENDELWRATVRELPDVAEFAETREQAIELALDSIESLKEAADEEGRDFPEPIEDEDEFSGRVTLRMPKYIHRAVAQNALADGMSLNSYIVTTMTIDLAQRVRAVSTPTIAATVHAGQSVFPKFEVLAMAKARIQSGVDRVGYVPRQDNVITTTNTAFYIGAAQHMFLPNVYHVVDPEDVYPIYVHSEVRKGSSVADLLDMQRKVG